MTDDSDSSPATAVEAYAERLRRLDQSPIRRLFNVQAPYRWNIRRLGLGRVLDVGCGIGRNLAHIGQGVGVDHNRYSIDIARERGLTAYTADEFFDSPDAALGSFDSMLLAHVAEHMDAAGTEELLKIYAPYVKPGGLLCLICPQEAGYKTDATHVRFVDEDGLRDLGRTIGAEPLRQYSFPFPRPTGRVFPYNEFVYLGRLP